MAQVNVDGIIFDFDRSVEASKYDDWTFFRKHFSGIRAGIKAVDLIACHSQDLYLVEVKDYRTHSRTKPSEISDEVAEKVLATLSALLPAKCNARVSSEQAIAERAVQATRIRVVLHLEQRTTHSRLRPQIFDKSIIQQKLRSCLRSVDPRVVVSDSSHMHGLPWQVS